MSSSIAHVCFYLEWVQSRFEHNQDTMEGNYVHRAVDAGGGRMGEAGDPPFRKAKSVELSSRRLGLIAKAGHHRAEGRQGRAGRGQARPATQTRAGLDAGESPALHHSGCCCATTAMNVPKVRSTSQRPASGSQFPSTTLWWHTRSDSSRSFARPRLRPLLLRPSWTAPSARGARSWAYACQTRPTCTAGRSTAAPASPHASRFGREAPVRHRAGCSGRHPLRSRRGQQGS